MKKLIPIFLLSLLISCTNDNDKRSNNLEDKSINESQTKWAKDSIKQRLEDSVKLEARNNLLKDYLKKDSIKRNVFIKDSVSQVELEKMQLMASKDLDSIYPIWRDKKLDSIKMFKNKLANNIMLKDVAICPSAWFYLEDNMSNQKRIKLHLTQVIKSESKDLLGIKTDNKTYLHINTKKDAIAILNLQVEGKNPMTIQQFLQGNKITEQHKIVCLN